MQFFYKQTLNFYTFHTRKSSYNNNLLFTVISRTSYLKAISFERPLRYFEEISKKLRNNKFVFLCLNKFFF